LREIYIKAFSVAMRVYNPAAIMTAYNATNGVYTAEDEELLYGIFRQELGFDGFVMTDWNSYDTANVVSAVSAGNTWMTPGTTDDTYVSPIVEGIKSGRISMTSLQNNVRYMLSIVEKFSRKE